MQGNETLSIPGGTVYLHVTPGAGGFGPPAERSIALVCQDVRNGKISPERARKIYRVVVSPKGILDQKATETLRTTTTNDGQAYTLIENKALRNSN